MGARFISVMLGAATLGLALLPGTGHAQSSAPAIWDRFIEECTLALDAPFRGVVQGLVNAGDGEGTVFTTDGKVFVGVRPLDGLTDDAVRFVTVTTGGERHSNIQLSYCTMIVVTEASVYLGFSEVAKARAAEVIGEPLASIGGRLLASSAFLGADTDFTASAITYTSPGPFPRPLSIRVQEVPRSVTLTLTKITEIKEN
ncbi:MAG: hypothetical protein AAF748_10035 [Pseudomonadota bacterium]